ncbi:MAG: amidase [Sulfitobacter sp.]|nr:amidase [Sulfitobacter sp.]
MQPNAILDDHLHRWEPHIHAFAALCTGTAPQEGPLAGLRVGVKDIIDVAGLPTRNGSDACRDAPPALQDAEVVARLRAAGAHILGKTTTTEFAFTDPTACRNPHDLSRSPGGSSSGSGAAVAAGVVDIAIGTQTAGSLCRPAAYCGAVGFKPTYGILPQQGVTPLAPSFDTLGIITRSVALAQRAYDVLAPSPSSSSVPTAPRTLCALWETEAAPDEDTDAALAAAAQACADLGFDLSRASLVAEVAPIVTVHRALMQYEAHRAHHALLQEGQADLLKPKFRAGLRAGAAISAELAEQAADYLQKAKQSFWAGLEGVDMILTLPVPEGAPLIDGTTGFQDWLTPWTVFGGPLVCLPWGVDRLGRPLSVMLAARPGQDHALLNAAAKLEGVGPPRPIPRLPRT